MNIPPPSFLLLHYDKKIRHMHSPGRYLARPAAYPKDAERYSRLLMVTRTAKKGLQKPSVRSWPYWNVSPVLIDDSARAMRAHTLGVCNMKTLQNYPWFLYFAGATAPPCYQYFTFNHYTHVYIDTRRPVFPVWIKIFYPFAIKASAPGRTQPPGTRGTSDRVKSTFRLNSFFSFCAS
jgi:hypothetical protein